MRIGFIGAGKVGFTLGRYFAENGTAVSGYCSRSSASAKAAARFTGSKAFESHAELLAESDAVFLTVPDSAIAGLYESLKNSHNASHCFICHCSGAIAGLGCSVHPCFAISSKTESYKELHKALFTIESSNEQESHKVRELEGLIRTLGNAVHVISAEQKVKYHAAACFMSNHVAALVHTGSELLSECGFSEAQIASALQTLFLTHCGKIAEFGAVATLVGPVERNDADVVRKHLECLDEPRRRLYACVTEQLTEIARLKNPGNDYSEIQSEIQP
jgi:predicted short-subunit dehydrogenase-like oxidoreductase (DUF2520 family)